MIEYVAFFFAILIAFCILGSWAYLAVWIGRDATERGFPHGDLLSFVAACVPVVMIGYLLFVSGDISVRKREGRTPQAE